jgi:protein-disulfide isomerase
MHEKTTAASAPCHETVIDHFPQKRASTDAGSEVIHHFVLVPPDAAQRAARAVWRAADPGS